MSHTLGDAPIEERYREVMKALARGVDDVLNGDARPKQNGFILMVFSFAGHGRCNYVSNAEREDVIVLLRELLARFEGMPESAGHA